MNWRTASHTRQHDLDLIQSNNRRSQSTNVSATTISVVIPTLWACPTFSPYIQHAANLAIVKEVIIIDNNSIARPTIEHPKIRVITQKQNIYVNPAWNLGAKLAGGDILCFLNDDFHPRDEVYAYSLALFEDDSDSRLGLIGMNYGQPTGILGHTIVPWRTNPHFGAMIFMRAKEFRPIPESIKIWWGDEFLVFLSFLRKKQILELHGYLESALQEQTVSVSLNTNRSAFNSILDRDTFLWLKVHRRLMLLRRKPFQALVHSFRRRALALFRELRTVTAAMPNQR